MSNPNPPEGGLSPPRNPNFEGPMAMLVPVRAPVAKIVPSPPQAPFDDAATHKLKCIDPKCAQCRFYSGFEGRLRKGSSKTTHAPAEEHAWKQKAHGTRSPGAIHRNFSGI